METSQQKIHSKMTKEKKVSKKSPAEPYWSDMVGVYFDFCRDRFNDVPSFDGSSPKDFKAILTSLRTRAESIPIEWTHETATTRLRSFLEYAFMDRWLSNNWILSNLNRQKDKIFFNIAKQKQRSE